MRSSPAWRAAPLIIPGRAIWRAKRLFPALVERTMDRAIARVRR
jgi:hypothetical protein